MNDIAIADNYTVVYKSPSPETIPAFSPSLVVLSTGRLVATLDRGGIMADSPNPGLIFTSDDKGATWQQRDESPLVHARLIATREALYLLGHGGGSHDSGDIGIMRSTDNAQSWSDASWLTCGQDWHAAPTNVLHANNRIYLVMERQHSPAVECEWPVGWMAPAVLSAPQDADLLVPGSWTISNDDLRFQDHFPTPDGLGIPFFPVGDMDPGNPGDPRHNAPAGWLEGNIMQINDPDHCWFDPEDRTFHILLRCHAGGLPNIACLCVAHERDDGSIEVTWQKAPSGQRCVFLPVPGGHNKFHILYDPLSARYFMAANIANDSMTRPELLPEDRYNLPSNERRYLGLFVSHNLVDWQQVCVLSAGKTPCQARNYASMAFDGDDLLILSRSGDEDSVSAHNSNLITFHRVPEFRKLLKPWN
ncbi:MAG: sialidase family protein [Verrucomicrobiota bacterium]